MKSVRKEIKELIFVRLNPGDDLLEGIRTAVENEGIQNAVILQGVGSAVSHSYHVVASSVNPPKNEFVKGERPADIVNINGFVIDGRVHAHIIFSDVNVSYGGHLEPGVKVLTFAALTLAEIAGVDLSHWDSIGNIEELIKQ
jgi:predicted DNA-binding protein with PD1-like motif